MRFRILILFLFSLFSLIAKGQALLPFAEEELSDLFLHQRALFPQEKTYLHIDRSYYIPGDTVWFCGYAVNASTLVLDTLSRYLYVDLQNPGGALVQQIKVLNQNGVFPGYLPLPRDLPAGNYIVSVYTLFMTGMDESYFFRRPLTVRKLSPALITSEILFRESDHPSQNHPASEQFDVSFFPEGGYLLAGNISTVGVKALNPDGLGGDITGTLFDSFGNIVAIFETIYKGMGSFMFIPETGKEYYAICNNRQGYSKRFDFPKPLTNALALRATQRGERLYINVGSGSETVLPVHLTLVMQSRGIVYYAQELGTSKTVIFDTGQLPSGVLHFLLLNEGRHILSERLVFSLNKAEQPQVALTWDKPTYSSREKVQCSVSVLDSKGIPLTGRFSVSVTDDRDVLPDTTRNILTELLLSSELKGNVETPGWYFVSDKPIRRRALDALMLTQGWRHYNVLNLLQGNFQQIEAPLEMGMELSGRVKSLLSSKSSTGTPVYMMIPGTNQFLTTKTDEEGRFHFSGFDFPDSLTVIVRALSRHNNDNVELIVDKENSIEILRQTIPYPYSHPLSGLNPYDPDILRDSIFTSKAYRKWTIENGIKMIHLDEVLIRGRSRSIRPAAFFSGRGALYDQEYIKKHKFNTVDQFFSRLPHVRVGSSGGELGEAGAIYVQGRSGYYSKTTVYIDNGMIPEEDFSIWSLFSDMIDAVEVTRERQPGMNTPPHSVRIWLKKKWTSPVETRWNQQVITLRGYQSSVEFYSPKYEAAIERNQDRPDLRTTIYWNPTLQTDDKGSTTFDFYTSDSLPVIYSVVIEGITTDGRIIHSIKKINSR